MDNITISASYTDTIENLTFFAMEKGWTPTVKQIEEGSESALINFTEEAKSKWYDFWYEGESPEIKMELLGTKALDMFTRSAKVQAFIKELMEEDGKEYTELGIPEEYSITWNKDGSGKITKVVVPTE